MVCLLDSDILRMGFDVLNKASVLAWSTATCMRSGRRVMTCRYMNSVAGTMTLLPWSCPSM